MDNRCISSNTLLPSLIFFCRLLCYEQHHNAHIMLNSNHFPLISYTVPPITLIHLAPCCNTYKEEEQALSNIILFLSFLRRPRQVLLWDSDVGYTLIRIGGKSCAPLTKHFRNDVLTTRMTVRRGSYARNFIHFSVIRGSKLVLITDPRFSKTSIKSQLMSPMYFGNILRDAVCVTWSCIQR